MKNQGTVISIINGIAKIRVERESSCGGNCVSCKGCPTENVFIHQKADETITEGSRVSIEKKTGHVIFEAFFGYGFPSLSFILGAVLGLCLFGTERASVLFAFASLAFAIFIVRIFSKHVHHEFTIRKLDM